MTTRVDERRRHLPDIVARRLAQSLFAVAVAVVIVVCLVRPVGADSGSNPGSTSQVTGILAIPAAITVPVCSASGSAALLVPILSGAVGAKLPVSLPSGVNIGDLILQAAGPVYVVCGDLPSSPVTQCQLDGTIAGVWPAQLGQVGVTSPNPEGNTVNAINAGLAALDLPPQAAAEKPLDCTAVVDTSPAPPAPPSFDLAPPTLPSSSPVPTTPVPTTSSVPLSLPPSAALSAPVLPSTTASPQPTSTSTKPTRPSGVFGALSSFVGHVPTTLLVLQLLAAGLLALLFAGGWITSGRIALLARRERTD